jgi:hypothetical protein
MGMAIGITALFLAACATSKPSNPGGGGTGPCSPETDSEFCQRLGTDCDAVSGSDNCNVARSVASCGSCTAPATCGGAGIPNRCGDGTATAGLFMDGFFPLGVFIMYPPDMPTYVSREFNTAWEIPDTDGEYTDRQWSDAAIAAGLKQIRRPINNNPNQDISTPRNSLIGWLHPDEPDANEPSQGDVNAIVNEYNAWKAADPDMDIYITFGGGDMLNPGTSGCNGPGDDGGFVTCYPQFISGTDIILNDIYPVAGWMWDEGTRYDITQVGLVLDKIRGYSPYSIQWSDKPMMSMIEGSYFSEEYGPRGATRHEIRAEMWDAIIHGARGLFFFSVVLDPVWSWDGMTPAAVTEVSTQNATITALSNVLQDEINPNTVGATMSSPQLEAGWRDTPTGKYFFVLNTLGTTVNNATISLSGIGDVETSATVYEEARSETITDTGVGTGNITDTFTAFAKHIYVVN